MPSPSPPPPALDARVYPHILDLIVDLADYDALLALRGVSSDVRARADATLCADLVVRAPTSQRTPGLYFYTVSPSLYPPPSPLSPSLPLLISPLPPSPETSGPSHPDPDPLPLPVFAFFEYTADTPYSPSAPQEYDGDDFIGTPWGWYAWGTHSHSRSGAAPPPRPRPFERARTPVQSDRAWAGVARALRTTRTLAVHGRALPTRLQAGLLSAGALRLTREVHVYPDAAERRVFRMLVPAPRLTVGLSLRAHSLALAPGTIPDFTGAVEHLTLRVEYYARYGHGDALLEGFAFPPALRHVVVVLLPRSGEDGDAARHPRAFGVLAQVVANAIPHLQRVRVTLVGVDPRSGPMLGLEHGYDPEGEPLEADGYPPEYETVEAKHWDRICGEFKERIGELVARQVRARGEGLGNEEVARAVGNVRVLTREEWVAEGGMGEGGHVGAGDSVRAM